MSDHSQKHTLKHASFRLMVTYFLAIGVCAFAMFFTLMHFESLLTYLYNSFVDRGVDSQLFVDFSELQPTVEANRSILYVTFILCGLALLILTLLGVNLVGGMNQLVRRTEASQRAKQRFLTMISHELRTPLTGLLGSSRLLMSTKVTEEQKHYIEQSIAAGNAMLDLINNILDYSKSGEAETDEGASTIGIADLVAELKAIFSAGAASQRNELRFEIDAGVPTHVLGDEVKVRQVLMNLVGNAIKFTKDGTIVVRVEAGAKLDELHFSVADSGIGIEPAFREKIFDPFVQANDGDARTYGGTGLGLAITKNLVESMGGEIGVDAREKGSNFWFALKMPATSAPVLAAGTEGHATAPSSRILVVEDDPISNDLISTMIRKMGHDVVSVSGGIAALDYLSENPVDVVLLDCQMPEISGFETCRRIRANSSVGQVLIIGMSASISQKERQHAIGAGMDSFLPKPFTYDSLEDVLTKHILMGNDRPIQLSVYSRLREVDPGNPGFVTKQVGMFVDIGRETLDGIARAASHDDLREVARLAHRFKSSCGLLGADRLADLLEDLRSCTDKEHVTEVLVEIEEEFVLASDYLAKLTEEAG